DPRRRNRLSRWAAGSIAAVKPRATGPDPARKHRVPDMALPPPRAQTHGAMNPPPITSVAARAALVCWLLLATSVLTRADEPSPQPDPGERISHASEIWKLIADQTFYGRYNPNGMSWAEYQSTDGRT